MPPSPIPAPLPPWARALLQASPFIAAGLQQALEFIGELFTSEDVTPSSWRRIMWVFGDLTDTDSANRAIFTWDIANITGGEIDGSWNDADYEAVETECDAFWLAIKPYIQNRVTLIERRYYIAQFNPVPTDIPAGERDKPFVKMGPPERIFSVGEPGTDVGILPPQCSISVTERTTYPRHWGRFYLPFPGTTTVGPKGVIVQSVTDAIGTSLAQRYGALQVQEFFPVVPVTQIDKVPARGLLTTTQVQVDNVFDVIRRRRTHFATHRFVSP